MLWRKAVNTGAHRNEAVLMMGQKMTVTEKKKHFLDLVIVL